MQNQQHLRESENFSPTLAQQLKIITAGDSRSPLFSLFTDSCNKDSSHSEDSAVIVSLCRLKRELEQEGYLRINDGDFEKRLDFMYRYAEEALSILRGISAPLSEFYPENGSVQVPLQGVVFFGSFVRGKPAPGDIDIRLVIPYRTAYFVNDFMMGYNPSQRAMQQAVEGSSLPSSFIEDGREIDINLEADSHYNEGGGLEFVRNGPYVAFFPGTNGKLCVFYGNGSGNYRKSREP